MARSDSDGGSSSEEELSISEEEADSLQSAALADDMASEQSAATASDLHSERSAATAVGSGSEDGDGSETEDGGGSEAEDAESEDDSPGGFAGVAQRFVCQRALVFQLFCRIIRRVLFVEALLCAGLGAGRRGEAGRGRRAALDLGDRVRFSISGGGAAGQATHRQQPEIPARMGQSTLHQMEQLAEPHQENTQAGAGVEKGPPKKSALD